MSEVLLLFGTGNRCGQCRWFDKMVQLQDWTYCPIANHRVKARSKGCHRFEVNM